MATAKTSFEKLEVYQCAEALADRLWSLVAAWPSLAQHTIGLQLIRALDSIGANIAEGAGRYTHIDNRHFVRIARGSLYETRHWLRCAWRRGLLSKAESADLARALDQLSQMLAGYLRSLTVRITADAASRVGTKARTAASPAMNDEQ